MLLINLLDNQKQHILFARKYKYRKGHIPIPTKRYYKRIPIEFIIIFRPSLSIAKKVGTVGSFGRFFFFFFFPLKIL